MTYSTMSLRRFTALGAVLKVVLTLAVLAIAIGDADPSLAQQRFVALSGEGVKQVIVAPGTTVTVDTDVAFSKMVVGNAGVADAVPLSSSSLYLQGVASGTTNIAFYNADNKLIGVIDVRVRLNYANLRREIRRDVPGANVAVSNINNRIRITGTVENSVMLDKVMGIAEQYTGEPVINEIQVTSSQQVLLQARILEVSRNSGRELGINLTATSQSGNISKTGAGSESPFGTFVGNLLQVSGINVDFVINALEAKGLARRLANPAIATLSGTTGNFVVGGEVPISISTTGEDGNVSTSTSYREYGIRLNFTPTVLDNGLINLKLSPEVSEIDESIDVNGNPGFVTRKADTTILLRDGQSFAIAGLLQVSNSRNIQQVPWLGSVPVLGALFRSTEFQKRETDLVIVVTPTLVRPGGPNEPLQSPLDTTRSSDDVELFLLGMLEVDKNMVRAFISGEGIVGPYGHIIDLEFDDALINKK